MYVCLCNGYRDRDIASAGRRGARSVEEAYRLLGNGPCCGSCVETAAEILDQSDADSGLGQTASAAVA